MKMVSYPIEIHERLVYLQETREVRQHGSTAVPVQGDALKAKVSSQGVTIEAETVA